MDTQIDRFPYIVQLTPFDHQQARQFWEQHDPPKKAKQIYLNTLAVCAVHSYLKALGIDTNVENGDSWDFAMQTLSDTADLEIPGYGKIECRPVLPNASACLIPFESREDRVGYIPVQFDRELEQAKLLGFTTTIADDCQSLPLDRFEPLETILDYLQPDPEEIPPPESNGIVRLENWLNDAIDAGWETIETLLGTSSPALAYNFRSASQLSAFKGIETNEKTIKRGKLFDLERAEEKIALFVGFNQPVPTADFDISVEVASVSSRACLPEDLTLFLLDAKGRSIMQADARSSEGLEFHFSGEPGERFSIKIALGDISVTEWFQI